MKFRAFLIAIVHYKEFTDEHGSAKDGILFNRFVAQSVEATNVRRNNAE
jgi:hypothetical protein